MERKSIQSIALNELSFTYPGATPIFSQITIEMPKSRAVWIRSPGGWGKSTLLRLMFGLQAPTSGNIVINGENVSNLSFESYLPYRLAMGYGFDMGGLMNNKTLFDNLILQLRYHKLLSEDEAVERVSHVLEYFGIMAKRDQKPHSVSGSVRKLTCLLRAFMHHPQVVFLDDPLTGLNDDNVTDLLHYMDESFSTRGLKQVFFTSENPALAAKFKAEELLISNDWFTTRTVA